MPSSSRSSSSAATPLPIQFVPLLEDTPENGRQGVHQVMPVEKKLSALEEVELEDEGGEEDALEKEMFCLLRYTVRSTAYFTILSLISQHCVYIDQELLSMVQLVCVGYIGAATLHHLEGYHVQSLELGTLMSDSTEYVDNVRSFSAPTLDD